MRKVADDDDCSSGIDRTKEDGKGKPAAVSVSVSAERRATYRADWGRAVSVEMGGEEKEAGFLASSSPSTDDQHDALIGKLLSIEKLGALGSSL